MRPIRVQARGLTKRYGDTLALDDVGFTLDPGTITVFLGRNGAGKSTTVRMMAGLVTGDGAATFAGRRLLDHESPQRVLGVDLGTPQTHPGRTVAQHLGLLARGLPDGAERVREVAALLGIGALLGRRPRGFSTGMHRAVALASVLVTDPSVLVLDEPSNGLEVGVAHRLKATLRAHVARGGTVLLASHVLTEAERIADRVLVLERGRVAADTPLADYLDGHRPAHLEVTADQPRRLAESLGRAGSSVHQTESGVLIVTGSDAREVAMVARESGVLVLGLRECRASLEEAFLAEAEAGSAALAADLGGGRR